MDRNSAVGYVFEEAATAIIFTTVTLVLGFGIFIFSQYNMTVYFGILIATVLSFAVVCDLLFLPSILLMGQPSPARSRSRTMEPAGGWQSRLGGRLWSPVSVVKGLCRNYFAGQDGR